MQIINREKIEILRTKNITPEGVLILIKKPKDWTSFDVVKKVRTFFKWKKVGHSGTLDPKAEGLMILAINNMTKQIKNYSELEKEYIGKMILGARTPSYDAETEISETADYSNISREDIKRVFLQYKGNITQLPPMYSAVKYRGKPLYKYARKGKKLNLTERNVTINELELLEFKPPEVKFRVICSKGTYIRSLVNDIGNSLGCGAYLLELVRTRIGTFKLEDAITIEELTKQIDIVDAVN